ncbi:hypothetical protein AZE42_00333 [Rhizopogon vesiculosus]|uniref:Uncharacterized protein n=1 Tax=Rhizopogon vesiculosus TaxID=180088 RepID=A0A1J8R4Y6_9AGAM|nr:hypothetical protein AZE42_00333 [Rhizopogon vesiculosus]
MSVSKLGGRASSYRKPVPKFIPSPPASPHGSPTSSARRLSFSHPPLGLDAPPLPSDWRDVIERAVSRERRTTSTLPAIDTIVDTSCPDAHGDYTELSPEKLTPSNTDFGTSGAMTFTPPTPTGSFRDEEPISRPSSPTPWAHSLRYTVKQPSYHEEYRPPTPPLSNQRKRSKSSESGCDSPTLTIISQLTGPHSTLAVTYRDSEHGVAPSISLEKSEPPPPPPPPKSSLPTPPASLTHEFSSPPYRAGHDKTSQPPYAPMASSTFTPGHDRRPSTLNSTLNFTVNSEKWTENPGPSVQALVKKEAAGHASDFPPLHPVRDPIRTNRRWWQSIASGFKRFITLGCL